MRTSKVLKERRGGDACGRGHRSRTVDRFFADLLELEGRIDVLLSQGGEIWDHAAEVAIVEAAGGRFRDPVGGHRLGLRGGTYTNAALEDELGVVLGRFSGGPVR